MAMKLLLLAWMALGLVACSTNGQIQASNEGSVQPHIRATSSDQVASSASLISTLLNQRHNWLEAKFIDVNSFPETITAANREMFDESGIVFSSVIPVTDTSLYLLRVGVFEDKQSQAGRFLAIFDEAGRVLQVFEDRADGAAYSALRKEPGRVLWFKCFECGQYDIVSRVPSGFVLD